MDGIEKRIADLVRHWRYKRPTSPTALFVGYAEEIALHESMSFLYRGRVEIKTYLDMKIIRVDASHYLAVGDVMEAETHE